MNCQKIVKQLREKLILSQVELAELLGVSFASINRLQTGKHEPTIKIKKNCDKKIFIFLVLFVFLLTFISCKNNVNNNYFVDFETNCSQKLDEIKVQGDEKNINLPEISRVGYTFEGWYTDSNFDESFSFDTILSKDITLYAKWSKDYTQKIAHYYGLTLYIDEDDDLYVWGDNAKFSELFFGEQRIVLQPTHVLEKMKFKHVAIGDCGYLLLIDIDGNLYHYGNLSKGGYDYEMADSLELISKDIKFKYASVAKEYVLAVGEDDNLYGWGDNFKCCIGGKESFYEEPTQLTTNSNILTCVNTDSCNSAFITKDGYLYTWGALDYYLGQPEIEQGSSNCITKPTKVQGLEDLVDIYMNGSTFVIDENGEVYAFGANPTGNIGIGNIHPYNDFAVLTPEKIDSFTEPIGKVYIASGITYYITESGRLCISGKNEDGHLNDFGLDVDETIYYYPYEVELDYKVKNIFEGSEILCIIDNDDNLYTSGYVNYNGSNEYLSILDPLKLNIGEIIFDQALFCNYKFCYGVYGLTSDNIVYQYNGGTLSKEIENIAYLGAALQDYPYTSTSCIFAIDLEGNLYIKGKLPNMNADYTTDNQYISYDQFKNIYPEMKFKSTSGWFAITDSGDVLNIVTGKIVLKGYNVKAYLYTKYARLALSENGILWGMGSNQHGELFNGSTEIVKEFTNIDFKEKINQIFGTNNYIGILTEQGNIYYCGIDTNGVITLMDSNVIENSEGNIYSKEDGLYTLTGSYYKADKNHYIGQGKSKVYFNENVKYIFAKNNSAIIISKNGNIYLWGDIDKSILNENINFYQKELKIIKIEKI